MIKLFNTDDSRSSVVKYNIFYSFGVKIFSVAINFLLVPLTIDYVSSELYGVWLTLATIIGWISIFDLGFGNGLRNKLAEAIAHENWERARELVSTTYFFMGIVFFTLAVLLYFLFANIPWHSLLGLSSQYSSILQKTMQIIIVLFCLTMVVKIQSTILLALQKTALSGFVDTIGQLLVLLSVYFMKENMPPSLIYLAYAICLCPIIVYLISSFLIFTKLSPRLSPRIKCVNTKIVRDILSLGVNFFIIQIAVLVLYQTINVIISNVSGPIYVTEYNVAYKYLSVPLMALSIIVTPFWTAFTDAYASREISWMRTAHLKLQRLFFMFFVVLIIMICLYPYVFDLWLGNMVSVSLSMVLAVAAYVLTSMWNTIYSYLVNGIGYVKLQMYISLISIFFNIPLALFLGHLWGAKGVVWSVTLFNMIPAIILHIQLRKIIEGKVEGIWSK